MGDRTTIAIVGAGGFAREVRWLVDDINRAGGRYDFVGYVVSDQSRLGENDDIDGVVAEVSDLESEQFDPDALALGMGDPSVRANIGGAIADSIPRIAWPSSIHPSVRGTFRAGQSARGPCSAPG